MDPVGAAIAGGEFGRAYSLLHDRARPLPRTTASVRAALYVTHLDGEDFDRIACSGVFSREISTFLEHCHWPSAPESDRPSALDSLGPLFQLMTEVLGSRVRTKCPDPPTYR